MPDRDFDEGPVFRGILLEGKRLNFGCPDLRGSEVLSGYGSGDVIDEVGDGGVGGVGGEEFAPISWTSEDSCRGEVWDEVPPAAGGN